MMDRQTAELLYPLDENTFLYDEEFIIGIRMQLANKQTWYNGKAILEHHHGYTTMQFEPSMHVNILCNSTAHYP